MIKFLDVIHFSENENFLGISVPVKGTTSSVVGEKVLISSPVTESSRTDGGLIGCPSAFSSGSCVNASYVMDMSGLLR